MNILNKVETDFSQAWERLNAKPGADVMLTPDLRLRGGDLAGLVRQLCAAFDAAGAREGERVFIRTKDEGCAVSVFVACILDGLVPVMVSPETPNDRAAHVTAITSAKIAVIDQGSATAGEITADCIFPVAQAGSGRGRLRLRKPGTQEIIADRLGLGNAARDPRLPMDPDALAYILFTSGTTSDPAGVMINRGALAANVATIARVLEIDSSARVFNDMILAHGDGLVQGPMLALLTGCAIIRSGGFSVDRIEAWLNRVRTTRATHFLTVPTIWTLIDRYCTHDDYFDAPEFRYLGTVAAAMPAELWERLEQRFNRPLINQYGLTETVASALYAGRAPAAGARFTIGQPVDCEAKIAPVEGADPACEEGELLLRGPNIFDGYWKNAERTAATLTPDGWLRTGDLVARREDGSYDVLGRLKTVIMSAGFLIRPEEIDDAISKHPGIQEVVTVGLPHPEFGEIAVCAFVRGADGPSDEELRRFAQTQLEPLKLPKRFIALESIPRGDAGKPQLNIIRELLMAQMGPAHPATTAQSSDIENKLIALAAGTFFASPDGLSLSSNPDNVPGWDSFTHIALILALEEGFGVRIPPHRAAALRSLGDAAKAIRDAKA